MMLLTDRFSLPIPFIVQSIFRVLFVGCCCLFVFTGCDAEEEGPCADVVCENGKECNEGVCLCGVWYSGERCETVFLAKNEGSFAGSMLCNGSTNYITISLVLGEKQGTMLTNEGWTLRFDQLDKRKFVVSSGTYTDDNGDTVVIFGEGEMRNGGDIMQMTLDYYINGEETTCYFSGYRP